MRAAILLVSLMCAPSLAAAVDDFRVMRLEQDIRTLEREVQTLRRLVGDLSDEEQVLLGLGLGPEEQAPPSDKPDDP